MARNPLRDLANKFVSKTQSGIDAANGRLNDAREHLLAEEKSVNDAAMLAARAGFDGDELKALVAANTRVAAAQQIVKACEQVVAEAEQAERERLQAADLAAAKTRLNSMRAILAPAVREAKETTDALRTIKRNWYAEQERATRVEQLAPGQRSWLDNFHWSEWHVGPLSLPLIRELVRGAYDGQNDSQYRGPDPLPFVKELSWALGGDLVHEMADYETVIKARNERTLAGFAAELGLTGNGPVPSAAPAPAPSAAPQPLASTVEPQAASPAAAAAAPGVAVMLPNGDIIPDPAVLEANAQRTFEQVSGVINPHPEGSEEAAEYDRALARIRRGGTPEQPEPIPEVVAAFEAEEARLLAERNTPTTEGEPT